MGEPPILMRSMRHPKAHTLYVPLFPEDVGKSQDELADVERAARDARKDARKERERVRRGLTYRGKQTGRGPAFPKK